MRSSERFPILQTKDLGKTFGGVVAVDVDDLVIYDNDITALIGPNGAGKTTFFDVVTGFAKSDRGSVTFAGTDISGRPPYTIAQHGLVRTFQLTRALSKMSVLDNMLLAPMDQLGEHVVNTFVRRQAIGGQEAANRDRAMALLERFTLAPLAQEYAGRLSGGQKKLLELARALMVEPRMVLLDEPMAGVNPALGDELLGYVLELRDEGMTFLFVEHDMDVVMRISDRVVVMATGQVIADGTPDVIRADPAVIDAYLGEHGVEEIAEAEAEEHE